MVRIAFNYFTEKTNLQTRSGLIFNEQFDFYTFSNYVFDEYRSLVVF